MIPWWGTGVGAEPDISSYEVEALTQLFNIAIRRFDMASAQIEALRAQVETTKGVMASAQTLLAGLHQRLVDAGQDPAALAAIKADLATETSALASAVAANPLPSDVPPPGDSPTP